MLVMEGMGVFGLPFGWRRGTVSCGSPQGTLAIAWG